MTSSSGSEAGGSTHALGACEAVDRSRARCHVAPVVYQPALGDHREPGRCDLSAPTPCEPASSGLERLGGDLLGENRITAAVEDDSVNKSLMLAKARRQPTAGDVITGTHTGLSDHGAIPRRANRESLPSNMSDITRGWQKASRNWPGPRTDRRGARAGTLRPRSRSGRATSPRTPVVAAARAP